MPKLLDSIVLISTFAAFSRQYGAVTAPQLMRMVNDLDKRVYRVYSPIISNTKCTEKQHDSLNIFQRNSGDLNTHRPAIGDLAIRDSKSDDLDINSSHDVKEQPINDHHLRLSKSGRKYEPAWYLHKINILCKAGDTKAATDLFFHKMLTVDRVLPDRNIVHVLLSGLAMVGDSESAFKVYRKMTELGIAPTNSTYSRLFTACAEDIAVWQRQHRYTFRISSVSNQNSWQPDLALFAGPGLERAKNLWVRLHDRGFRMNRTTYNALLQALGRAGDLHTCFQALDFMLLGRGGLPPSILGPANTSIPSTCTNEPLPPFRPDEYTLTAVLTAVKRSFTSGVISSPLDALRLALQVWHLVLPRLPRQQPSQHHFTLMAGILGLTEPKCHRYTLPVAGRSKDSRSKPLTTDLLEVIPESLPKMRALQLPTSPRLLASHEAAKALLRRVSLLTPGDKASVAPAGASTTDTTLSSSSSSSSGYSVSSTMPETTLNWDDPDLVMQSPLNLLLPLPPEGVRVRLPLRRESLPPGRISPSPWQRLSLLGGLEGLLRCIHSHFKLPLPTAAPLITKLVSLLPPPTVQDNKESLDRWEVALLAAMKSNRVSLDVPILNTLLQRRTTHGLPVNELMALANRQGLSPDEFTWGCLARSCRTAKQVRTFLTDYSKAAVACSAASHSPLAITASSTAPLDGTPSPPRARTARVRPSLHVYATLFASTHFHWDSKVILLRSMMGADQLTSRRTSTKAARDQTNKQPQDSPLHPNQRIIANLELEIANFRHLVARGIVPKDGSYVEASPETGGVLIPPYSLRAFKRFIPVYKEWAEQSIVSAN